MNNCSQPSRYGRKCYSNPSPCAQNMMADLSDLPLAMAYVPMQHFKTVYELDEAFQNGTIFPELNKPFYGSRGGCRH